MMIGIAITLVGGGRVGPPAGMTYLRSAIDGSILRSAIDNKPLYAPKRD